MSKSYRHPATGNAFFIDVEPGQGRPTKQARDRKTTQLCAQTFRVVAHVVAHEQPTLADLNVLVHQVTPCPDTRKLCVWITTDLPVTHEQAALDEVKGAGTHRPG